MKQNRLKEEYDAFKTPLDNQAWENFKDLRRNSRSVKKKSFWQHYGKLTLGVLVLLSSFLWIIYNTGDPILDAAVEQNPYDEAVNKFGNSPRESIKRSSSIERSSISTVKTTISNTVREHKTTTSDQNNTTSTKNINKTRTYRSQQHQSELEAPINFIEPPKATITSISEEAHYPSIAKKFETVSSTSPKNNDLSLPTVPTLIQRLLYNQDAPRFGKQEIAMYDGERNVKRNHIQLSSSYAYFYGPKGIFSQLDYRYDINKILSLGSSLGYGYGSRTKQVGGIRQSTSFYFIHASVYFHFINNPWNKLYLKGSTGWLHSKPLDPATSPYQELSMLGIVIETGYSRYLLNGMWIGIQGGSFMANEGGNYIGMHINYEF